MATSGVISTNTKYGSCFWVKWEISGSQSISGNKTTIAWSCGLTPGEQYYDNAIHFNPPAPCGAGQQSCTKFIPCILAQYTIQRAAKLLSAYQQAYFC